MGYLQRWQRFWAGIDFTCRHLKDIRPRCNSPVCLLKPPPWRPCSHPTFTVYTSLYLHFSSVRVLLSLATHQHKGSLLTWPTTVHLAITTKVHVSPPSDAPSLFPPQLSTSFSSSFTYLFIMFIIIFFFFCYWKQYLVVVLLIEMSPVELCRYASNFKWLQKRNK